MNGALVALGMVVVSIVVAGVMVYRISSFCDLGESIFGGTIVKDQSSLNEDLWDILGFIPLDEIRAIVNSFVKYDKQVGDVTVGYIRDNARHIVREFTRIPEFQQFVSFLEDDGLDLEYWHNRVVKWWEDIPTYIDGNTPAACGGLSSMVNRIVETIPQEELHELLGQKARYSASFRNFVGRLRSPNFEDLCGAVEGSKALQRHYFWANDDGMEVIFGIELLKNVHAYLAYEL